MNYTQVTTYKPLPFEDPNDERNGSDYHTGSQCIEPECTSPAGTYWSPLWCFNCNVQRMRRITATLERLAANNCNCCNTIAIKGGEKK